MGFFSLFSRKKKSDSSENQHSHGESTQKRVKSWHHSISHLTIVTQPLGETPGTVLEESFIYNSLVAISREISLSNKERFSALADALDAKLRTEGISIEHYDIVGLSFDASLGYSSRMSAAAKKFTILLGEPRAVARASTPFHSAISNAVALSIPEPHSTSDSSENSEDPTEKKSESFVLAIDGIAYAALTLTSEYK